MDLFITLGGKLGGAGGPASQHIITTRTAVTKPQKTDAGFSLQNSITVFMAVDLKKLRG